MTTKKTPIVTNSIPKIEFPTFKITIPSSQKILPFRRLLVKEEKILLMALEEKTEEAQTAAVQQCIVNCCLDTLDVENLPLFDIEWIYLKLQENSSNSIIKAAYRDPEDKEIRNFDIPLSSVQIKTDPTHSDRIELYENNILTMKYPTPKAVRTLLSGEKESKAMSTVGFEIISECLFKLFQGNVVHDFSVNTKEEKMTWLETLSKEGIAKISTFFKTMPKLFFEIKYTNKNGKEQVIVLDSLNDFFPLR